MYCSECGVYVSKGLKSKKEVGFEMRIDYHYTIGQIEI